MQKTAQASGKVVGCGKIYNLTKAGYLSPMTTFAIEALRCACKKIVLAIDCCNLQIF